MDPSKVHQSESFGLFFRPIGPNYAREGFPGYSGMLEVEKSQPARPGSRTRGILSLLASPVPAQGQFSFVFQPNLDAIPAKCQLHGIVVADVSEVDQHASFLRCLRLSDGLGLVVIAR